MPGPLFVLGGGSATEAATKVDAESAGCTASSGGAGDPSCCSLCVCAGAESTGASSALGIVCCGRCIASWGVVGDGGVHRLSRVTLLCQYGAFVAQKSSRVDNERCVATCRLPFVSTVRVDLPSEAARRASMMTPTTMVVLCVLERAVRRVQRG